MSKNTSKATADWTVLLYMAVVLGIPPKESLYCTVWVYIIMEMTTQAAMPVLNLFTRGMDGAGRYVRFISGELLIIAGVSWMIQQLWYRQQDQYRISQENIELINRKCHDLKHQMAALTSVADSREKDEQLKEMARSVMIYDSAVKTGNPVLDTVLTEKSLYCEEHQINMTCMADGTQLGFVGNVDLYTMFGNALDDAVESVMKQEDVQKRVIQVSVFHEKNLQMIRVRNYCDEKPVFSDGLPVSTKKDRRYHGYGLKSIRYTAEKYGGGIICQAADNYFVLQILLPIPESVRE